MSNPLIEAAVSYLDSKVRPLVEGAEDEAVTKKVESRIPKNNRQNVVHVASEGNHHVYANHHGDGRISYLHHDSSTGKTTNLGRYGKSATESAQSDMSFNAEYGHGIKLPKHVDKHMTDYHDANT